MKRRQFSDGAPWEPIVGYSRAMVEVRRLIDRKMLVEIEACAVVGE